jgi:excisionase family DNA binding protein
MPSMPQRPLDTVETLAARFCLPRRTVVREVMRGRLPYVSVGGARRFRDRDIEVWLERSGPLPRLRLVGDGSGREAGERWLRERLGLDRGSSGGNAN